MKVKQLPASQGNFTIDKNIAHVMINDAAGPDIPDSRNYEVGMPDITGTKTSAVYNGATGEKLPAGTDILENDTITYTITLTNAGNETGTATVTDMLDINALNCVNINPSKGTETYENTTGKLTWVVDVDPDETVKIEIETKVNVLPGSEEGLDINQNIAQLQVNGGENISVKDLNKYHVTKLGVNITKMSEAYDYDKNEIEKTGTNTVIHEGYFIVYTITIKNNGNETVNTEITDALQTDDVDYLNSLSDASENNTVWNEAAGTVSWSGNVNARSIVTIKILVKTKNVPDTEKSQVLKNNIVYGVVNGENQNPVTDVDTYTVTRTDISSSKTSIVYDYLGDTVTDTNDVHEGDIITYTIQVKNNGILTEKRVVATDNINIDALQLVSYNCGGVGSIVENAPGTGELTWTGDLTPGQTINITIVTTVKNLPNGATTLSIGQNVANVTANNKPQTPATDQRNYTVKKSNITISKTSTAYADGNLTQVIPSGQLIHEGDTIVYTVTIQNIGDIREKGVQVLDPINTTLVHPATQSVVSGPGTVIWNNTANRYEYTGILNPGDTAVIQIAVKVNTITSQPNGFTIPNNVVNTLVEGKTGPSATDSAFYTVGKANISGVKTSQAYDINGTALTRTTLYENESITYTITLTNTGNEAGTTIINDTLLAGLTFVSSPDLTSDEVTSLFSIGGLSITVNPNDTQEISFTTKVTGSPGTSIRNSAMLNRITTVSDSKMYTVISPVITVVKSSNYSTSEGGLNAGDKVTYTLTVTLTQGNIARNVVITDAIPTGTTVSDANGGTISGNNIVFNLGDISPNGKVMTVSFEVQVTVNNKNGTTSNQTQITNTASATADNITGQVTSNTVNIPLEQYTVVPVAQSMWDETFGEILDVYPVQFDSSTVFASTSSPQTFQIIGNDNALLYTVYLYTTGTPSTGIQIHISITLAPGVEVGPGGTTHAAYLTTKNDMPDFATAIASMSCVDVFSIVPDGQEYVYNEAITTGQNRIHVQITNLIRHTGTYGYTYTGSATPVPGNTYQAKISGTTAYGKAYVDTIVIPAGGAAIFANVPYGTYTVTEEDINGNPINQYVLINTNNASPTNAYSSGYVSIPSANINVNTTAPTIYIHNINPYVV